MTKDLVSIGIPAYKATYLKEAIETLTNKQKIRPNNIEIREVELKVVNAYSYL